MKRSDMLRRLKAGEDPLKLTIEKWEDIVKGRGRNDGTWNCALCEVYYRNGVCRSLSMGSQCPIRESVGRTQCEETPYNRYVKANTTLQRKTAAKEELKFLKGLKKASK